MIRRGYEDFRKLPPDEQQRLRERSQWYRQLPPDQRESLRDTYRRLPREQRESLREKYRQRSVEPRPDARGEIHRDPGPRGNPLPRGDRGTGNVRGKRHD